MYCAISGEHPKEPVVSKTTGNVFEKHLLETYLSENQTDPVTNEPATIDDYVELKVPQIAPPRPPNLTSLPSLLSVFQTEWDSLALETFNLRKQLLETRQELSTALYQHDAACRVILRLQKERDEAREALAKLSINGVTSKASDEMQVDHALPPLIEKLKQFNEQARAQRKKRKLPETYATIDELRTFHFQSKSQRLSPLYSTIALDPESGYKLALLGPRGHWNAHIYDTSTGEWKGDLSDEHGDVVTDVDWFDRGPVIAGSNGTISIWSAGGSIKYKLQAYDTAVVGVDIHPAGGLMLSASQSGEWSIHDLTQGITVVKYKDDAEFTCANLHPDGQLYAIGTSTGKINVYDVFTGELSGTIGPRPGSVKSMHFSQNGIWLAETSVEDNIVRIWDLRKTTAVAFELEGSSEGGNVRWDHSGQYLALGGQKGIDIWAYQKKEKQFEKVTGQPLQEAGVMCFDWGVDGKTIICGGQPDGKIAVLGV